jgi:hypothetical protein
MGKKPKIGVTKDLGVFRVLGRNPGFRHFRSESLVLGAWLV